MAVCPQCGGSARRLLAPGYYECTSEIEELVDVLPPHMHAGPGDIPMYRTRTCGARYQLGEGMTGAVQCRCGMFAVSACSECHGEPRCGEHSVKVDGRVLCSVHAAAAAEAAREQAQLRRQRQEDEDRRGMKPGTEQVVALDPSRPRPMLAQSCRSTARTPPGRRSSNLAPTPEFARLRRQLPRGGGRSAPLLV